MQVMIWFVVYLVLIAAMALWREHHDAAARARRRGTVRARAGERGLRGVVRHSHRTS